MKHYIIVKFKKEYNYKDEIDNISQLFNTAKAFKGVEDVIIHKSNSTRENRFHLMIEMQLTNEGLEIYDKSEMHKQWKNTYGDYIESKAIFDCE